MSGLEFLDTNVLVYAFSRDNKAAVAQELLARRCRLSVQILNEFANVGRRKLGMSWAEVRTALGSVRALCGAVVPLSVDVHDEALRLAERYQLSIYDALVVAAALVAECGTLWSEVMHDGLLIDGRLRVENPFRSGGLPTVR